MLNTIFITGIGTDVGKTIASAILAAAMEADYWKPVQAGYDTGTDSELIRSVIGKTKTVVHPETYKLKLAASPHIAAKEEGACINLNTIEEDYRKIVSAASPTHISPPRHRPLIVEGAGGLMVPLNEKEFVIDLIKKLNVKVILVSRNYLGSINHSLLTAAACRQNGVDVLGWIFNDQYLDYEDEIVQWSGYPKIASLPFFKTINAAMVYEQAAMIRTGLQLFS